MTNGVPEVLVSVLNSIGISKSSKCPKLDKAVEQKISQGYDPRGRGYGATIVVYDNIGFRQRKGYKQYTLLGIIHIDVNELIAAKIYPDPTHSDRDAAIAETLSHDRLDWNDEKDEFCFGITERDGEILTETVVLPYIHLYLTHTTKRFRVACGLPEHASSVAVNLLVPYFSIT